MHKAFKSILVKNANSCDFISVNFKHYRTTSKLLSGELQEEQRPLNWDEAKPYSEIPGIKTFWGGVRNILPGGKLYKKSLKDMHVVLNKEYGDVAILKSFLGQPDIVMLFNPKDFEQVYRNEGSWPHRRDFETFLYFREKLRTDVYEQNKGLLAEQGEKWKNLRTKVNPVMMQPRIVKQYVSPVEEVSNEFIERMLSLRDSNNEMPSNFSHELNKWSLESIARISLDSRLGCLKDDEYVDEDSKKMIQAIHDFFDLIFQLEILPSVWRYIKTPAYNKLMAALDVMTNVSLKKVDAAIERIKNSPNKKSDHEASVLEKLLKIDRNVAVIMAMDMILAGVDTTSHTVAILLYHLAVHKECQEKLRDEILTILPNKNSKLTAESFNHIPYLRACMKEANRVLPIAGGTVRRLPVDLVLSGYQVPKGSEVVMSHLMTSMQESQFPNPKKFIPERWLNGQDTAQCPSAKTAHPFSYMPFGFGPRSCVGKRFADLEIETLIVKLLRNYKIEWNYGDLEVSSKIFTIPVSPLRFKMTEI